jgi:multicomponent Na+:H+ antiporter subunit C
MMAGVFYIGLGIAIFLVGLHGLLVLDNKLRQVIAVNLMGAGVFLVMVSLAVREPPIDPVLQALVVTGLVVAISATAFALRLISAQNQYQARQQAKNKDGAE